MGNTFTFGSCIYCGKNTALRNGICAECKKTNPFVDLFGDSINDEAYRNAMKKMFGKGDTK